MKLKITQKLRDAKTAEWFEKGDVIERSDKRGKELIEAGAAEEIKEKAEPKAEPVALPKEEAVLVEPVAETVVEAPKAEAKTVAKTENKK